MNILSYLLLTISFLFIIVNKIKIKVKYKNLLVIISLAFILFFVPRVEAQPRLWIDSFRGLPGKNCSYNIAKIQINNLIFNVPTVPFIGFWQGSANSGRDLDTSNLFSFGISPHLHKLCRASKNGKKAVDAGLLNIRFNDTLGIKSFHYFDICFNDGKLSSHKLCQKDIHQSSYPNIDIYSPDYSKTIHTLGVSTYQKIQTVKALENKREDLKDFIYDGTYYYWIDREYKTSNLEPLAIYCQEPRDEAKKHLVCFTDYVIDDSIHAYYGFSTEGFEPVDKARQTYKLVTQLIEELRSTKYL